MGFTYYWNIQSLAIYKHLLSIEQELLLANCCWAPNKLHTHSHTHAHINMALTQTLRLVLMKRSEFITPLLIYIFSSQVLHFLHVKFFFLIDLTTQHNPLLHVCVLVRAPAARLTAGLWFIRPFIVWHSAITAWVGFPVTPTGQGRHSSVGKMEETERRSMWERKTTTNKSATRENNFSFARLFSESHWRRGEDI